MSKKVETIKFAVVGCGHIGKRHATMVTRNIESELVALCDIKPKEILGLEDFNVPYFSTIDALLDTDIDVDVVCICTPNGFHAEHAVKALKSKRHVVIEKPMGLTKAECEKVIFKALNVSRNVFCVMQNRYSPPSVWIKGVMTEG